MMRCPARRRRGRPARRFWLASFVVSMAFLALHSVFAHDATASDRDVHVGGGCVLIRESGGETLAVGDCDRSDVDPGGGVGDESGGRRESSTPELASPEETMPERTTLEEMSPEVSEPERAPLEESTQRERTAPGEKMPGEGGQCPVDPPEEAVPATVASAIDGDTLKLEESVVGGDTVRLIGVDSPELKGEGGESEPGAGEAAAFTAERLEDRRVLLQFDRERLDSYGRLLAYVWVAYPGAPDNVDDQDRSTAPTGVLDGVHRFFARISGRGVRDARADTSGMFNLDLIEEGHAKPLDVEPNTLYAACFERVADEEEAAEEQYEQTQPQATAPEATAPETTPPEIDESEQTDVEEAVREKTSPEDPPATQQYEREEPPEETLPEEKESEDPEELSAPAPDEELCPAAALLDGVEGGDASTGDAKDTLAFTTKAGGILLAYAAAPADEAVEGGLLGLSVLNEDGGLVGEPIAFQREGAELALIETTVGDYRVEIDPANRRFALDVYECAGLAAGRDAPEEPPQDESSAPPAAEPAAEEPVEEIVSRPAADPVGERAPPPAMPAEDWGLAPEPRDTLASRGTPEDPVPTLPDTGGPAFGPGTGGFIVLALGCVMISSGVLLFVSLRQAERRSRRKAGSGGDRERL